MSAAPPKVLLCGGDGVSIAVAARLLVDDGFDLAIAAEPSRRSAPVVMLSDAAAALLRSIFSDDDLLADAWPIHRRVVAWGGAEPVTMPHPALAVTRSALAAAFKPSPPARSDSDVLFTVHGTAPFPAPALQRYGSRLATVAAVEMRSDADSHACHVEAVGSGWLFLIPVGPDRAWLLGVGGAIAALLDESRLIAQHILSVDREEGRFETAPRLLETLAGEGWLACGTEAIAFDPICGDGTAQAAREAILAAAVLAGLRDGGDPAALVQHYRSMLLAAMRRHLQISLSFYRGGGGSAWWQEQADATAQGYARCTARLATMPEPRFTLRGAQLVPRELAV